MMSIIESHRELMEGLKVEVKIDHNEVLKVVVIDLIQKYMSGSCDKEPKYKESFAVVLKYYLGEEDFIKYVVKGHPVD